MAITLVAHAGAGAVSNATTSAIDTTGATLLVAWINSDNSTTITPQDSQANTWTPIDVRIVNTPVTVGFYYCASPSTNASHTFTAVGTNNFAALTLQAFAGVDPTPLDQTSHGTNGFAGTVQPGSITPSVSGCVVVSGAATIGQGDTTTITSVDSGFTITD